MLNFFRNAAQTWVFKILFALLIVSFAVWGIGDLSLSGRGSAVATVAGRSISVDDYSQALQRELQSTSQRLGRRITIEEAQQAGLPQILLARLIRDEALNAETEALGVSADDAALRQAIVRSPSFQGLDGSFDEQQYKFILDRLGFRPEEFEADMRAGLARDILNYGVASGVSAPEGLAEAVADHAMAQRVFQVLRLTPEAAPAPAAPTDAELQAFLDENEARFTRPESRAVRWIAIAPEEIAGTIEISDEALRAAYEERADAFSRPERRAIAQLGFPDEAAAQDALDRIAAGETSFEALAEDRGLTVADTLIDTAPRGQFPPEVAEAGFALDAPGATGPVSGGFGPSILYVAEILPAGETPYEEAKDALRLMLAADRAQDRAVEMAESVADLLASGAALPGVASDLGLTVHEAPALTRDGDAEAGTYGADPALIAEAFEAVPGEERDMIETEAGGWALVAVDDVAPAAPMTLEEARDEATAAWTEARRLDALEETAEAVVAAIAAGEETLEDAAARLGVEAQTTPPLRRTGGIGMFTPEQLETLFALDEGAATLLRGEGAVSVVRVADAIAPDLSAPQAAGQIDQLRDQLAQSVAQDMMAYFAAAVQERADASIRPDLVDQVVNSIR